MGSIRDNFGEVVILNLAANQLGGDVKLTPKVINLDPAPTVHSCRDCPVIRVNAEHGHGGLGELVG